MFGYDYLDRRGYCDECDAGWFVSESGNLEGCCNSSCFMYASPEELND